MSGFAHIDLRDHTGASVLASVWEEAKVRVVGDDVAVFTEHFVDVEVKEADAKGEQDQEAGASQSLVLMPPTGSVHDLIIRAQNAIKKSDVSGALNLLRDAANEPMSAGIEEIYLDVVENAASYAAFEQDHAIIGELYDLSDDLDVTAAVMRGLERGGAVAEIDFTPFMTPYEPVEGVPATVEAAFDEEPEWGRRYPRPAFGQVIRLF